jgi:hypothetical protein
MSILYIHGMGGGADSRIPAILNDESLDVIVRTYDFDPEVAAGQISAWVAEIQPDLIVGESLGSLHALKISGIPKILVSPALNAPIYFEIMAWLTLIPGLGSLFDRIYRPREGDRQSLHFTFDVLRKYLPHRREALAGAVKSADSVFAFIGTRDHYRRSGVVSVRTWKKYFGDSYVMYDGTHFTEEEHIRDKVIPLICNMLNIKQ